MPAASCRIMPARSIRRCDTISASFGFSLRMGRKNRDNRMGILKESVETREAGSETGSGAKTQGRASTKAAKATDFLLISLTSRPGDEGPAGNNFTAPVSGPASRTVFRHDAFGTEHQSARPPMPAARERNPRHHPPHIFMPECSGIL